MVAQTARPVSIQVRAYQQAGEYLVFPASCERNDWEVQHLDGHGYTVDLDTKTCTCPDFQRRGHLRACKHIELVKLHAQAEAMFAGADYGTDEEPELVAEETDHRAEELRAEAARETQVLRDRALLWD
jgi:hypothetical protein